MLICFNKIIYRHEKQQQEKAEDHDDLVKNLKYEMGVKSEKLKEILTTPKQVVVAKK